MYEGDYVSNEQMNKKVPKACQWLGGTGMASNLFVHNFNSQSYFFGIFCKKTTIMTLLIMCYNPFL